MASMNMIEALNSALDMALTRDPDTPISEGGIISTAIDMDAYGLRPIAEI
jgi:2-oxoisovalerate dehydrogenase E1 component beta subunit